MVESNNKDVFQEYWDFVTNPFFKLSSSQYDESERIDVFSLSSNLLNRILVNDNIFLLGKKGTGKSMILSFLESYYLATLIVRVVIKDKRNDSSIPLYVLGSNIKENDDFQSHFVLEILNKIESFYLNLDILLNENNWFEDYVIKPIDKFNFLMEYKSKYCIDIDSIRNLKDDFIKANNKGKELRNFLDVLAVTVNEIKELKKDSKLISFSNLEIIFKRNLRNYCMKMLLLLDEFSGFSNKIYKVDNEHSQFTYAINSLRNQNYLNYKIAIESETYSAEVLKDRRLGHEILLDYDITDTSSVKECRKQFFNILLSYIRYSKKEENYFVENNFSIIDDAFYEEESLQMEDKDASDCIEQFVLYSEGVIREFIRMCGAVMKLTAEEYMNRKIGILNVQSGYIRAVARDNGYSLFNELSKEEKNLFKNIAKYLRKKRRCVFAYKNSPIDLDTLCAEEGKKVKVTPILMKPENNREVDYYKMAMVLYEYLEIPTHLIRNSNNISVSKSILTSEFISEPITIEKNNLGGDNYR